MKSRGTEPREHIGPWLTKYAILTRLGVVNPVIVDGGACIGNTTEFYLRMWPHAQVYCFEPNPTTHKQLQERYRGNPRIHVYKNALGAKKEAGRVFHIGGRNGVMSSLQLRVVEKRQYYYDKLNKHAKVDVTTLDDLAERENIDHIDILKLDLQGGEYDALRGARGLLNDRRVSLIYVEVLFVPVYKAPTYLKVFNYLDRLRYTLFDLYDIRRAPVNRQIKVSDAMFVSPYTREKALDTLPVEWRIESRVDALGAPR